MAEYFPIDVSSFGSYSGSFSGSFFGNGSKLTGITASFFSGSVTSASYAATASYLLGSIASASYAATASYLDVVNHIDFNTSSASTSQIARLVWNNTDGTLELGLKGGVVKSELGQGLITRIVNKTVPNIYLSGSNYQVVVVAGAQGQRLAVKLAQANNDANSAGTLGLVAENIDKNQEGFIVTVGLLKNINTTGAPQGETWTDGDILYLSPSTAGQITNIKPQAPLHTVIIGYVEYAHANNGKIYVKIDNGYELDELHNVRITTGSLTSGDLLVYSSSVWINTKQLTGSYGLTGSLTATSFTGSLFGTASWATNALTASFISTASTNAFVQNGNSFGATALLGTNDNQSLAFETSGSVRMFVSSSGNIGIGTSTITPLYRLDVSGSARVQGTILSSTGTTSQGTAIIGDVSTRYTSFAGVNTSAVYTSATTTGNDVLAGYVGGSATSNAYSYLQSSGYFGTRGSVKIGAVDGADVLNTSTTARLQVRGSGATSATTALRVENTNASASLVVLDNGTTTIYNDLTISGSIFYRIPGYGNYTLNNAWTDSVNNNSISLYDGNGNIALVASPSAFNRSIILKPTSVYGSAGVLIGPYVTGNGTAWPNILNVSGSSNFIGNVTVTGSQFTFTSGSSVEFRVTGTGVSLGNIITDTHTVTGSLNVSGSVQFGTGFTWNNTNATLNITSSATSVAPFVRLVSNATSDLGGVSIEAPSVVGAWPLLKVSAGGITAFQVDGARTTTIQAAASATTTTALSVPFGSVNFTSDVASGTVPVLLVKNTGSYGTVLKLDAGSTFATGWYLLDVAKNGTTQFSVLAGSNTIVNTGNLLVGNTTGTAKLQVRGSGATSATTALRVENTNASASLVVLDNGFVGIGTGSAQFNLDVNGTARIKGTGTTNATFGLTVQNSASTDILKIGDGSYLYCYGDVWIDNDFRRIFSGAGRNAVSRTAAGTSTIFYNAMQLTSNNAAWSFNSDQNYNLTAGSINGMYVRNTFGPTSGTATFTALEVLSTINQTGGANGITRGLYVNPTLTSAANFRAIETTSGSILFQNGSVTSTNGFTGSLQGTASWATNVVTASAAGANTTVQYNNNGVLGGTSKFTFDSGTALLFVDGGITTKNTVTISGSLIVSGSSIITGSLQVGVPGTSAATIDTTVGTLGRGSVVSVDWVNRLLSNSSLSAYTVDWENVVLNDSTNTLSIDWGNRTLTDSAGNPSINWENRTLTDATNTYTALDYSSDTKITSNLYYNNIVGTAIQDVVADNAYYAGQTIEGTVDVGVSNFNLVSLDTDGTWKGVKAAVGYGADKMLGICVDAGKGLVLIEGDIGVSDDNSQGPYIVGADHGLPVYIYTTTGQMTTTAPSGTNEIVRVVGHIYYQSPNDANLWIMKFRPSNDWYVI